MLKQYAFGFYEVITRLEKLRYFSRLYASTPSTVDKYDKPELLDSLATMRAECENLSLDPTSDLISFMESEIHRKGDAYTYSDLLKDIETLSFSFANDLRKRFFFCIPDNRQDYFQRDDLFGPEVSSAFPSCTDEIQRAGSCFALEQWDASVFHLMKTLERGLRALAAKFRVPFEHTNWHNVIEQIEASVRGMNSSFGTNWREQQKFYSEAASQFMFLKAAWRNYTMHVGDVYDEGKALSILTHVRVVMQALAGGGLHE